MHRPPADPLPPRCHVVLPGLPAGCNVAVCVRGECGVHLTRLDFGEFDAARRVVRELNESLGIGAQAEQAMLAGCLLGWGSIATPRPLLH